jgi:hypothetical protein
MIVRLAPGASRGAALTILLGVVALVYLGTAVPLLATYGSMRDSIAQLQDQLQRYQARARDLDARKAELAALQKRPSSDDGFLQGKNETLVAAQIQNRVKALADATHSELKSTQVLPAEDEGKRRRIGVRGQISTTVAGAQRVIYGLESASPILFIDNLDVRSVPSSTRFHQREIGSDVIDMQFDVYGYMHGTK